MKTLELLLNLQQRGNGKTTLQQVGTKNYDRKFLFICKDSVLGRHETGGNPNAIYVPIEKLELLGGHDLPIAISHTVIEKIVQENLKLERIRDIVK